MLSLKAFFVFAEMIEKSSLHLSGLARVLGQVMTRSTEQEDNGHLMFYPTASFSRLASLSDVLLPCFCPSSK